MQPRKRLKTLGTPVVKDLLWLTVPIPCSGTFPPSGRALTRSMCHPQGLCHVVSASALLLDPVSLSTLFPPPGDAHIVPPAPRTVGGHWLPSRPVPHELFQDPQAELSLPEQSGNVRAGSGVEGQDEDGGWFPAWTCSMWASGGFGGL